MGEAIARADYEILERIIRMQLGTRQNFARRGRGLFLRIDVEIDGDQMPAYLLGGAGEGILAVGSQELYCRLVRTAYIERAAVETHNLQLIEPFTGIGGVEHFCAIEYIGENAFDFLNRHAALLYDRASVRGS